MLSTPKRGIRARALAGDIMLIPLTVPLSIQVIVAAGGVEVLLDASLKIQPKPGKAACEIKPEVPPQQMWCTDGGERDPIRLFEQWLKH